MASVLHLEGPTWLVCRVRRELAEVDGLTSSINNSLLVWGGERAAGGWDAEG